MHSSLISALLLSPVAFAAYEPRIRVTPIAEGIYVFESGRDGYNAHQNVIAVVNQRDVLMFDTNARPTTARAVLAELRKITPKPVRWVVNSHQSSGSLVGQRSLHQGIPRRPDHRHRREP